MRAGAGRSGAATAGAGRAGAATAGAGRAGAATAGARRADKLQRTMKKHVREYQSRHNSEASRKRSRHVASGGRCLRSEAAAEACIGLSGEAYATGLLRTSSTSARSAATPAQAPRGGGGLSREGSEWGGWAARAQ